MHDTDRVHLPPADSVSCSQSWLDRLFSCLLLTAGALTFLHWKMYRFFAGYAHTYSAAYYRSRQHYYGGLTIIVGTVQLALGKAN